jgi:hypothetical protein
LDTERRSHVVAVIHSGWESEGDLGRRGRCLVMIVKGSGGGLQGFRFMKEALQKRMTRRRELESLEGLHETHGIGSGPEISKSLVPFLLFLDSLVAVWSIIRGSKEVKDIQGNLLLSLRSCASPSRRFSRSLIQ